MQAKLTALREQHRVAGARMVDFAGWRLPLHFGSQVSEHHAVRNCAGVFDVSHLALTRVSGRGAKPYLRRLLANDVERLGRRAAGLYSCLLNESGGVIDDLIAYRVADGCYRIVSNAATAEPVREQMRKVARAFPVRLAAGQGGIALAVQGPQAMQSGAAAAAASIGSDYAAGLAALKPFGAMEEGGILAARTGYTGEDGFEIYLEAQAGQAFWQALLKAGVAPCGLGARDTLRLEAGLCLHGQDMDASVTPLHCGLKWTVALDPAQRDFVGRRALEELLGRGSGAFGRGQDVSGGAPRAELPAFRGLVLQKKGMLRAGQKVRAPNGPGVVTSGGYSPTMNASIGLARVPPGSHTHCEVEIRGAEVPCAVVKPPFVRRGRVLVDAQGRQSK